MNESYSFLAICTILKESSPCGQDRPKILSPFNTYQDGFWNSEILIFFGPNSDSKFAKISKFLSED